MDKEDVAHIYNIYIQYIYFMAEYIYSAIKRNEIELFVMRWMDLESVIQSEVSQKEKDKYLYANTYMESKKKKKCHEEPRGKMGIKTLLENGLEDMGRG